MARTTPAQKPRGWASITFIKTSRFDTGLRSALAFDSAFWFDLRPAAARRPRAGMFGVIYVARGACGSSVNPFFFKSLSLLAQIICSAVGPKNQAASSTTSLNSTFERKCPDVSRTRGETLVRGLENAQTKNA